MKCASEMWATAATTRTLSGSAYARSMASRARSRRRFMSSTSRLTVERYGIRERVDCEATTALRLRGPAGVGPVSRPDGRSPLVRTLLGVGLILSLRAVTDRPDVAVGVREGSAVPAPLQLRRGLEDLAAGLLGLVHDLVHALFATYDVVEDNAAEAVAVSTHAGALCQTVAAIEADERTAVWNEEHGDLVVL